MRAASIGYSKTYGQLSLFTVRCCDCGHVKSTDEFQYCAKAPFRAQYRCTTCRAGYDRIRNIVASRRKMMEIDPIPRLLAMWKPPAVNVALVEVVPRAREAVGR
jgi:hypothetical protein